MLATYPIVTRAVKKYLLVTSKASKIPSKIKTTPISAIIMKYRNHAVGIETEIMQRLTMTIVTR